MKNSMMLLSLIAFVTCQNSGNLKVITDLPKTLHEVSGTELVSGEDLIWMHNDSGNKSELYVLNTEGKIKRVITLKTKNHDWEDITSDEEGNLYIGDFGNNTNDRKNLSILKIAKEDLQKKSIKPQKIKFSYPNQHKFPPKKKQRFFDAEAFFYFNDYLYIFTKSSVKEAYGKTVVYKIPAKKGEHIAQQIATFNNCNEPKCRITAADISPGSKKMALLTQQEVLVFSNFSGDDFFNGKLTRFPFNHSSQKEGVAFKTPNTLYITDERTKGVGGNLYELNLIP